MRKFYPEFLWELKKLEVYRAHYRQLKTKLYRNVFCPAAFLYHGNGLRGRIFSFLWQKLMGKCIPNSLLMKLQVVFNNKHKFHLEKIIFALSVFNGDWRVCYRNKWRARVPRYYSHSYVFFINQICWLQLRA